MSESRDKVLNLLNRVLDQPFTVCWCGDPWCQSNNKLHLTDEGTADYIQQIALHEATHLLRGRGGHEASFWEQFEALVQEYLGTDLNAHQSKMKKDYLND